MPFCLPLAPVLVLPTRSGVLALLMLEIRDHAKACQIGNAHHDKECHPIIAHGFFTTIPLADPRLQLRDIVEHRPR